MQKGSVVIYILVGILILAALGGAYYFGKSQSVKPVATLPANPVVTSQTPQPIAQIANWKTYTNDELQYTFKYPPDWQIGGASKDVTVLKDGYKLSFVATSTNSSSALPNVEFHFYYKDQIYNEQYTDIFKQILSTFKYINK